MHRPALLALVLFTVLPVRAEPPRTTTVCRVPGVGDLALDDEAECDRQGGRLVQAQIGRSCEIDGEWVSGDACDGPVPDMGSGHRTPAWQQPKDLPADWQKTCPQGWFRPDDARFRLYRIVRRYGTCMIYKYDRDAILKQEDADAWAKQGKVDPKHHRAVKALAATGRPAMREVAAVHDADAKSFGDICRIPPGGELACSPRALTVRTDF